MKKRIIALAALVASTVLPAAPVQAEPFVGEIRNFGFNFCPVGWAEANGALLAISSNDALFSLFGTIYGGDGRTTFGLPDLRGRVAVNYGQSPGLSNYRLGSKTGSETSQLTQQNLPIHAHGVTGVLSARMGSSTATASAPSPAGNYIGVLSGGGAYTTDATSLTPMAAGDIAVDVTTTQLGNTGSGQAMTNMAPFLVTRYCVALFGIYPSRS